MQYGTSYSIIYTQMLACFHKLEFKDVISFVRDLLFLDWKHRKDLRATLQYSNVNSTSYRANKCAAMTGRNNDWYMF